MGYERYLQEYFMSYYIIHAHLKAQYWEGVLTIDLGTKYCELIHMSAYQIIASTEKLWEKVQHQVDAGELAPSVAHGETLRMLGSNLMEVVKVAAVVCVDGWREYDRIHSKPATAICDDMVVDNMDQQGTGIGSRQLLPQNTEMGSPQLVPQGTEIASPQLVPQGDDMEVDELDQYMGAA